MQKIEPLNQSDLAHIEAKRKWVRQHFTPESEHLYSDLDQKLRLLDTIIKNKWIEPSETVKLQSLGITLGDALSQRMGWEWVAVEDEYGRDPALKIPGSTLTLFPMTMISKRIEKGELVDVHKLFSGVIQKVTDKLSTQ
jgi:hypothetical protein